MVRRGKLIEVGAMTGMVLVSVKVPDDLNYCVRLKKADVIQAICTDSVKLVLK